MRIGSTKPVAVDVRILAATNPRPGTNGGNGARSDLYYRLNVIRIAIPPLRERIEDIVPLSVYYMNYFNKRYHQRKKLTREVISELEKYPWPGNVRELKLHGTNGSVRA